jgi:hypothetical protein
MPLSSSARPALTGDAHEPGRIERAIWAPFDAHSASLKHCTPAYPAPIECPDEQINISGDGVVVIEMLT